MKFNLISNISNGVGLQQDYSMLRTELEALGHEVQGVHIYSREQGPEADINIFLELSRREFFPLAKQQWLVPNPEWFFESDLIGDMQRVMAKTNETLRIFSGLANGKTLFLGWRARDLYDPAVKKERVFLHVSGKSQFKNTEAVLECWSRYRPKAKLILVGEHYIASGDPNVSSFSRVSEQELAALMNGCQFHLIPSAAEGYGHVLHEAFGVRAVVITTNAPPMNEVPAHILLPPSDQKPYNHGILYAVTPGSVYEAVQMALTFDEHTCWEMGLQARQYFDETNAAFSARLKELVDDAA